MRTINADALVAQWEVDAEQVEDVIAKMFIYGAIHDVKHAPTIEPEPHWIPCSKRLPEPEKKIYWVCTDGGYQFQCRWTNINHFWTDLTTDWHWHIMDVPQYSKVIAWKSLPKPPRGENNGADMRGGE